jgi:hypothetical protein
MQRVNCAHTFWNAVLNCPRMEETARKRQGNVMTGNLNLMIGTCVVYVIFLPSDYRRWEARVLYSNERGSDFRTPQYTRETAVSARLRLSGTLDRATLDPPPRSAGPYGRGVARRRKRAKRADLDMPTPASKNVE